MVKKKKPIDAWLIEDKNMPEYYISRDVSTSGRLFNATVFGTYLYVRESMAVSVAKRCGGRVVPIKIVFKQDNIIKKIKALIRNLFVNMSKCVVELANSDMEDTVE